ncbi:MAG: hypothetical protein ABW178_05515 [Pseudoxanthomonas sp.]
MRFNPAPLFLTSLIVMGGCGVALMAAALLEAPRLVLTSGWFNGVALSALATMVLSHRALVSRQDTPDDDGLLTIAVDR